MFRSPMLFSALVLAAAGPLTAQVTKPRAPIIARLPRTMSIAASQQPDGKIRVVWRAVEEAASYKLFRSVPPEGTRAVTLPNPSDTGYVDADVKPGSTYYYVVAAVDENGTEGMRAGSQPVTAKTLTPPADTTPPQAPVAPPTEVVATIFDYLRPQLTWKTSVPGARFIIDRREDDGSDPAKVTWQPAVTLVDKSWPCSATCSFIEDPRPIRRNTTVQYRITAVEPAPSTRKSEPVTSNTTLMELIPVPPVEMHLLWMTPGESRQLPFAPGGNVRYTSLDSNAVSLLYNGMVKAKQGGVTFVTASAPTADRGVKVWAWQIWVSDNSPW